MLKSLELIGFKSFADRTRFDFGPGVTGVVGPNGSGKSNVVDALKWILGEQSAKGLRGKEMTDVIFNGGGGRKPLGMAEVSLVFSNASGVLAVSAPEVILTRRLYRSGESEYLVNNQIARLRDFKELFLGTGAGLGAYSIIEQGKVEQMLSASSVDRRLLFEEAAGVTRYKAKRIEALRRLDKVEQNLVRAQDLFGELDKQLRALRGQAGKAKTYREYADELKELRLAVGLWEYHGGRRESTALESAAADAAKRLQEMEGESAEVQRRHDALAAALAQREGGQSQQQREAGELRNRLSFLFAEISAEDRRCEELQARIAAGRTARLRLEFQTAELAEETKGFEAQLQQEEREQLRRREDWGRQQQLQAELAAAADPLRSALQEARALAAEKTRELARMEGDLAALDAQQRTSAEQIARLKRRRDDLIARVGLGWTSHYGFQRQLQAVRVDLRLSRGQAAILLQEHRRLLGERNELLRAAADARERKTALTSRIDVLHSLQQRREGLDGGVQQALQLRAQGHPAWRSVLGLLAEFLEVETEYADLVELALGPLAQGLLVRSAADLDETLIGAARGLSGRVRFLPLDERESDQLVVFSDELGASLASLVDCEEGLRPMVDRLLAGVLLVPDYLTAQRLARRSAELRFVTPAGEMVESDGSVSAGPGRAAAGLLARNAELRELVKQVESMEQLFQQQQAARDTFDRRISRAEDRLAKHNEREAALVAQERHLDTVLRLSRQKIRGAEQEHQSVAAEVARCLDEVQAVEQRWSTLRALLHQTKNDVQMVHARLADVETEAASHEERVRQADRDANAHQIALAVVEERAAALSERLRRTQADASARLADLTSEGEQIRLATLRLTESDAKRLSQRSEYAEHCWRLERLAPSEGVGGRGAGGEKLSELTERLQTLRSAQDGLRRGVHGAEMRLMEVRLQAENALSRIRDDYAVDLTELWTPNYEAPTGFDAVEARGRIEQIRGRITRLGAVNVQAVENLDETEQRASALRLQLEDLNNARRHLQEVIDSVNEESRRLFLDAFTAVRGHFQELFRKLFGGGKADLILEDETDVFESGVEIIARPPGKEPRSLSLLSGGEKTLTAAALLMALFRSKPSPFCILDEVDAALDESNISRFVHSLREFLTDTQFILVTHSKTTMAAADVLHGVTQRESGVSIRVSVRLEDVAEDGAISNAVSADDASSALNSAA